MNKSELIERLRNLVGEGRTEDALDLLSDNIYISAKNFANDVVMLKSQYHSAKSQFLLNGVIENAEFNRIVARVNLAILVIADRIELGDKTFGTKKEKGHLMHKIPSIMIKDKEAKCVIRIAYFLENLYIGLTINDDTITQAIQVTGLMSVELLDDNEVKTFEIRTSTDEEQFIIHEEFTEWIFKVRPLRVGNFLLVLKIGAVELINGKERKRNIIIEKEIKISIEPSNVTNEKFVLISLNEIEIEAFLTEKEKKYLEIKELEKAEKEHLKNIEAKRLAAEQEIRRRQEAEVSQKMNVEGERRAREMKMRQEEELQRRLEAERKEQREKQEYFPIPEYQNMEKMPHSRASRGCLWIVLIVILIVIAVLYFSKIEIKL